MTDAQQVAAYRKAVKLYRCMGKQGAILHCEQKISKGYTVGYIDFWKEVKRVLETNAP